MYRLWSHDGDVDGESTSGLRAGISKGFNDNGGATGGAAGFLDAEIKYCGTTRTSMNPKSTTTQKIRFVVASARIASVLISASDVHPERENENDLAKLEKDAGVSGT
jgi:hypothetical protein